MCTVGCARIILFIFNFVFWLAGAGLLGIGVWMKVDETIVNYLHVVNIAGSDPLIDHAATLFIAVGGFVFLVGFLGCCGALRKNQACLFIYAALVLIAMLAEFAGAILALLYRQKVQNELEKSMKQQIQEEYNNGTATQDAWDFLQIKLACCGAKSSADYQFGTWWNTTRKTDEYVPLSCCKLEERDVKNPKPKDFADCQMDAEKAAEKSEYLNTEGCFDSVEKWFHTHSIILMGIGFGVGFIQIFGFIVACCLRSALRREKSS